LLRQCKASPYKTLRGRWPRRFFQHLIGFEPTRPVIQIFKRIVEPPMMDFPGV
jgi:hypothetical protein